MSKKITFTIDLDVVLKPWKLITTKIKNLVRKRVKPLRCPICGKDVWLRFDKDVRCYDCSVMNRRPHAPAIWHNHHEDAGIRAWNHWVRQFDKDDPSTWEGEVCLNYLQYYDLGYDDPEMTKNNSTYEYDANGTLGYKKTYDRARSCINKITGPHYHDNPGLVKIFGEDSMKFLKPGISQRIREMFFK